MDTQGGYYHLCQTPLEGGVYSYLAYPRRAHGYQANNAFTGGHRVDKEWRRNWLYQHDNYFAPPLPIRQSEGQD